MVYLDPNLVHTLNVAAIVVAEIATLIIGFLLVRLGHDLLTRGVRGEFNFTGELKGWKLGLASASPGTLFALLGAVVVVATVFGSRSADIRQGPTAGGASFIRDAASTGALDTLPAAAPSRAQTNDALEDLPDTPPSRSSGAEAGDAKEGG